MFDDGSFKKIRSAIGEYKGSVTAALKEYRNRSERLREDSKAFKDEKGYTDKYLPGLQTDARKKILKARDELCRVVRMECEVLELILYKEMTHAPLAAFSGMLKFYIDFGIVPNRMEARALLDACQGNALGIRALNGYLEKSKSTFRISGVNYDEFASDLEKIAIIQRLMWTNNEYHVEAAEIFSREPKTLYREDGSEYENGTTWNGTSLILSRAEFEAAEKDLVTAEKRWTVDPVSVLVIEDVSKTEAINASVRDIIAKNDAEKRKARDAVNEYVS